MKSKTTAGRRIFVVFNILFMLFIIAIMFLPYLNIFARAFNDPIDTGLGGVLFWPREFTLDNFKMIFAEGSIYRAAIVSVVRVIVAVVMSIIVQFSAAYALSKERFIGKNIILKLFMLPMFLVAGQMPTYVWYSDVGLLNNFWVYITPFLFNFMNIVIIRTYIQSNIPKALEEAAFLDGASELTVFFRVILPLCKPILATIALWVMVQHWNDYTTTLVNIRNSELYTLQYKMMELIKESERQQQILAAAIEAGYADAENASMVSSDATIAAQIVITTVPIICTYPFLQKYFVSGVTMGSVKG